MTRTCYKLTVLSVALISGASATSLLSLRGGALKPKSEVDKTLYALGCNVGRQVGDLDCFSSNEIDMILVGLKDTLIKAEEQVNLMEYLPKVAEVFKERSDAHLAKVEAASAEALAQASKESGAITTDSGLVIKHLKEGDGESPTATSTVRVHYTGTLADGSTFDSSVKRGMPLEFELPNVVQGWQEGIAMMKVGGKAKLTLPAALGYGDQGKSTIPPNSTLIFEVELLAILAGDAAGEDAVDDEVTI